MSQTFDKVIRSPAGAPDVYKSDSGEWGKNVGVVLDYTGEVAMPPTVNDLNSPKCQNSVNLPKRFTPP